MRLFVLGLLALLFLPLVARAALTDDVRANYHFENSWEDSTGVFNLTANGAVFNDTVPAALGSYSVWTPAITDDFIQTKTPNPPQGWAQFTFVAHVILHTSGNCYLCSDRDAGGRDFELTRDGSTNKWDLSINTVTGGMDYNQVQLVTGDTEGSWTFFAATYDGSDLTFYAENSTGGLSKGTSALPEGAVKSDGGDMFYNGDYAGNADCLWNFDEITWWNRSLSAAEIDELYNSGSYLAHPFSSPPTPVINWGGYSVANDTRTATVPVVMFYNVTTQAPDYCEFYNSTHFIQNNTGPVVDTKHNFTHPASDGPQIYQVKCPYDGATYNSSLKYIVIDTTAPSPAFNIANNSEYYNESTAYAPVYLFLNVTATDETGDLYDLENNLTDSNGHEWYSYVNGSLNWSYSWAKNLSINKTGAYTWFVKSCDSASIDLFETGKEPGIVAMRDRVIIDSIEVKNLDGSVTGMVTETQRYGVAFSSSYAAPVDTEAYVVTSLCPIHYLPGSRHSALLVSKECGQSVEFDPHKDVDVVRLNKYAYRVTIRHEKPVLVSKTETVHYLNCQNATIYFTVLDRPMPGALQCLYNSAPYLGRDIRMLCYFNESTIKSYECLSYSYKDGSIVKSNPPPEYVVGVGLVNTFSSDDRAVSVYFDTEHLRDGIPVDLVVECSDNSTFQNFSVTVTPRYKDPYEMIDYAEFGILNLPVILFLFFVALAAMALGGVLWRFITNR
jgi:hypothetical protein